MASPTGTRTNAINSDAKLERNDNQTINAEKQSNRKRNNNKRGGVKRRISSLAYHQQQYMLMRGTHPGGRPLHPPGTNSAHRAAPMRYPGISGPLHHFPPQKFGFFNEATPSVHPGHPGSEKRIYEGPPKPRLMMEERARTSGSKAVLKPPKLLASSGLGGVELNGRPNIGAMLELGGNKLIGPNEHQAGMNELFAKMIWKKLDMIQSPMRLNRLHTEIMNLLQQAIAEETGK
uniref:Uncharacterized protein n=1 Tax=Setaria digitata TaxID=48799 RepID=A0A915Q3G8_9BILA